jgi:hypothetical protein
MGPKDLARLTATLPPLISITACQQPPEDSIGLRSSSAVCHGASG